VRAGDARRHRSKTRFTLVRRSELDPDPLRQFERWFAEARSAGVAVPEATALATASGEGVPSVRMVLLKGADPRGFVFYTSYLSRKARELDENPRAALLLWWPDAGRQVRVEGGVERTSQAESEAYFASRPLGSRLGAWASPQGRPIPSREWLEARMEEAAARHPDDDVPRPPYWGGYVLRPRAIEFWEGRPNRLHDREELRLTEHGWTARRLSP
jgi:pyridoxamine 5'-phosphate oxidase